MSVTADPSRLLERVQELSERVDALTDEYARELTQDLVSAVMAMYGDGLERILAAVGEGGDAGATILDRLSQDGAVSSLLLIHDLYPVPLRDRVIEALDTVRPYMESHGGNVELVSLEDGVARLAMQGSCNGCAASRATLEQAIEQALAEHAPDLAGLEVSGVTDEPQAPTSGMALPMMDGPAPPSTTAFELPVVQSAPQPRWVALDETAVRPAPQGVREVQLEGSQVLFADVRGSLLAYESRCASCGGSLRDGELRDGMLRCPACKVEFDLPRAGRAAGGEPLQLRPLPLLESDPTHPLRVAV